MKERPILFSGPMVKAILEGRKNQTRRVVKLPHNNPLGTWEPTTFGGPNGGRTRKGETIPENVAIWHTRTGDCIGARWVRGDWLWVRETFQPLFADGVRHCDADWRTGKGYAISYVATDGIKEWIDGDDNITDRCKPAIHMPRWASRITLEVTDVRVQRLQDISEDDAKAEGLRHHHSWGGAESWRAGDDISDFNPQRCFMKMWDSINARRAPWASNPWVWAISFKRIEV